MGHLIFLDSSATFLSPRQGDKFLHNACHLFELHPGRKSQPVPPFRDCSWIQTVCLYVCVCMWGHHSWTYSPPSKSLLPLSPSPRLLLAEGLGFAPNDIFLYNFYKSFFFPPGSWLWNSKTKLWPFVFQTLCHKCIWNRIYPSLLCMEKSHRSQWVIRNHTCFA